MSYIAHWNSMTVVIAPAMVPECGGATIARYE